jgi:hypothetical protein
MINVIESRLFFFTQQDEEGGDEEVGIKRDLFAKRERERERERDRERATKKRIGGWKLLPPYFFSPSRCSPTVESLVLLSSITWLGEKDNGAPTPRSAKFQ